MGFAQSKSSFLFHVRVNRNAGRHEERTLSILEGLGIRTEECERGLDLPITAETQQEVAQRLRSLGVDTSRLLVGLHPGSVWATKRWSAEGFARLIGMLKEKYPCEILLFGAPEDAEVIAQVQSLCGGRAVSLVERIALPELPAALGLCKVLVTNDSGPMHIAVARAVPVVAIFCATTPALGFYPYSSKAIVLEKIYPAVHAAPMAGGVAPSALKIAYGLFGPEQVFQAVERLLESARRPELEAANRYLPQFVTV